jgi:hypothetical protein
VTFLKFQYRENYFFYTVLGAKVLEKYFGRASFYLLTISAKWFVSVYIQRQMLFSRAEKY